MNVWRKPLLAAAGKVDSCGSLLVNVASGNKVVLTGWNHDNLLTDAEKARLILRSAGYACGGKSMTSYWRFPPVTKKVKPANAARCREAALFPTPVGVFPPR